MFPLPLLLSSSHVAVAGMPHSAVLCSRCTDSVQDAVCVLQLLEAGPAPWFAASVCPLPGFVRPGTELM